jgi:hypothetical protein
MAKKKKKSRKQSDKGNKTPRKKKKGVKKPYKFTPAKRAQWIGVFEKTRNVSAACAAIGIARKTAYEYRDFDADFKRLWDESEDRVLDAIESKLYVNALSGDRTCIFFILQNRRADRWKNVQHSEITGKDGGPIRFEDARAELIKRIAAKKGLAVSDPEAGRTDGGGAAL